MDVKKALGQLPEPDPDGEARVWTRFEESRAVERGGILPWLGLGRMRASGPPLALLSTAALLIVVSLPEGERSLVLDADKAGTVAWSEQVDLTFSGTGSVSGISRDLVVNWEAGTLRAEVEPNTGTGLSVVTEEGEIEVVGTVFSVRRDALGVTTWVERGRVEVRCADGWTGALGPDDAAHTCLPIRPGMLLGRADALRDHGAASADILDTLDRGIDGAMVDGVPSEGVYPELLARRMELLAKLGQIDRALSDAQHYLSLDTQGGRGEEVRRFAGWLALGERSCDEALFFLDGLEGPSDRILLGECLVQTDPDRAHALFSAALAANPEPDWVTRAEAGLRLLERSR